MIWVALLLSHEPLSPFYKLHRQLLSYSNLHSVESREAEVESMSGTGPD